MKQLSAEQLLFLCVSTPRTWFLCSGELWSDDPQRERMSYPHVRYTIGISPHWFIDPGWGMSLIECDDASEFLRKLQPLLERVTP